MQRDHDIHMILSLQTNFNGKLQFGHLSVVKIQDDVF